MSDDDKKDSKTLFDNNPSVQDEQDVMNNQIMKNANQGETLIDLIKNATGSATKKAAPRLAFAEDPNHRNKYAGIYKLKDSGLLPENVIKEIRVNNLLIAAILRARGNTVSMMGNLRKDRFDIGIECQIKGELKDHIKPEQMSKIQTRIDRFLRTLLNCGFTEGLREEEKMTLPEFLDLQVRKRSLFW